MPPYLTPLEMRQTKLRHPIQQGGDTDEAIVVGWGEHDPQHAQSPVRMRRHRHRSVTAPAPAAPLIAGRSTCTRCPGSPDQKTSLISPSPDAWTPASDMDDPWTGAPRKTAVFAGNNGQPLTVGQLSYLVTKAYTTAGINSRRGTRPRSGVRLCVRPSGPSCGPPTSPNRRVRSATGGAGLHGVRQQRFLESRIDPRLHLPPEVSVKR